MHEIRRVYWGVDDLCNLSCNHCYNRQSEKCFRTEDEVLKASECLLDAFPVHTRIGGGEPLMYEHLFSIMNKYSNKNVPCSITTNGILLTKEIACKLRIGGVRDVIVSLEGTGNIHDENRNSKIFEKIIQGVQLLVTEGIAVYIGVAVSSKNLSEIVKVAEFSKKIGASGVYFFRYVPNNKSDVLALDKHHMMRASQNIVDLFYRLNDEKFQIVFEKLSFFSFLLDNGELSKDVVCNFCNGVLDISTKGEARICPYVDYHFFNVFDGIPDNYEEAIEDVVEQLSNIPVECTLCRYAEICKGGCKGDSFIRHGDFSYKDQCCFIDLLK